MAEIVDYRQKPEGWEQDFYSLESYEHYASIKALRSSELKILRRSPAHYKASIENKKPFSAIQERTLAKGKAFDVLTLHGMEAFDNIVTVEPDLNRNSKVYKEWKAANVGAECILSAKEKADIIRMHETACLKDQFSKIFMGEGFAHRVAVWQDSTSGLWCKSEIDFIMPDGTVVDIKSTADAGFWFFQKNAMRLGYYNQGAHYLSGISHITGIEHNRFLLAAVEVEAPHESHVFRVSQDQLGRAAYQNEENMAILAQCLERDEWPGYPDRIMDLETGHYVFDDYEILIDDEETEETTYGF